MSACKLYPERPIVGVGILIRKGSEYLLIKRAAEPDMGFWSIPGGLVKVGERVKNAAIREAKEETGLDVEIKSTLGTIDKIIRDDLGRIKYHFIIINYLAEPIGGEMSHNDDALDARWVHPKDFPHFQLTASLVELMKRIEICSG